MATRGNPCTGWCSVVSFAKAEFRSRSLSADSVILVVDKIKSSVKRVTHICYTKFVDTATLLHMVKVFSVILLISIGVLWIFCFFMGLSIRKTKKHLKFKLQLHRFDIEYLLHAQNSILALD